ncbi:lantibiotic dehydratase [Actinacidiphila paucisporea]|uniref:Lantibiotic dehydratase, C terminus n=1 Tax=Actinacidiphila paucisporea TaxID=310782 RepID=A0A1M7FSY6_9ACTN|nr:lantibiotic dehydratase [Actinacidiphila paucisporea]SHM06898.1 Lantibiotic dehydratase, C terminus [Actinacidiphila paucisporea]
MAGATGGVADVSARVPAAVTVAPYALVRTVALAAPEPSPDARAFRECAGRLVELTLLCEQVADVLCDGLYDRARTAAADVRARVLVPLRRDVHNRRSPRSGLRTALAGLDLGMPVLDTWLSARDEIDRTAARLALLGPSALRADRGALAGLCRSEDVQRAVALTSADLLRAVRRAAAQGAEPDKQGRKSEAAVLRYAMRAVTRTSPLSWFCHVGWGRWEDGAADPPAPRPAAVARVQRSLLDALVQAVLTRPQSRSAVDYRLAPGLCAEGPHLSYRRASPAVAAPGGAVREEKVTLRSTPALRLVVTEGRARGAVRQHDLAAAIAHRLAGPPRRAQGAAAAFVTSLVDQGLLQPVPPFDPQARDIVPEACRWLAGLGLPELAGTLAGIGSDTESYPRLPAAARPARLDRIRSRWSAAFSLAGAEPVSLRTPLTEDVVLPSVASLGRDHGKDCLPDIARLGPLFELFDGCTMLRRTTRDRFVARFGVGGTCDALADFADEMVAVREECDGAAPGGTRLGPGTRETDGLLRLRAELARLVPAAGPGAEAVLPQELLDEAARRTPAWIRRRPASYAVFVQPVPDGDSTRLCVNHVYGGWGRFTSRFLDQLDPAAGRQVSARIADALGEGERVAQVRPVGGFNANLHPRLVADEVSEAAAGGTLRPEQLQLFHDAEADQVRLRVTATGRPLSVLYLGFLMPSVLPDRWMPLVDDLGSGPVDLGGALAPSRPLGTALGPVGHRPRLRYRDVIVSRAQWRLPKEMVHAWRAELDRDPPVSAASRRRALLGIPEHVFIAADPGDAAGTGALLPYLARPRSQYVDLGSALHLRWLSRVLARYPGGVVVSEALPVPRPGTRAVEFVAETYRSQP